MAWSLRAVLLLSLAVSGWSAPVQTQTHAALISATPAAEASVDSPSSISLAFSAELARNSWRLQLTDADGKAVTVMVMPTKDGKTLLVFPESTLRPGVYSVSWSAVSAGDGQALSGVYRFTVQSPLR
jgi:copper resistance protein C